MIQKVSFKPELARIPICFMVISFGSGVDIELSKKNTSKTCIPEYVSQNNCSVFSNKINFYEVSLLSTVYKKCKFTIMNYQNTRSEQ